jgi:hypothetical protein
MWPALLVWAHHIVGAYRSRYLRKWSNQEIIQIKSVSCVQMDLSLNLQGRQSKQNKKLTMGAMLPQTGLGK